MIIEIDNLFYKNKKAIRFDRFNKLLKQSPFALVKPAISSHDFCFPAYLYRTDYSLKVIKKIKENESLHIFSVSYWVGGAWQGESFNTEDVNSMWITIGDEGNIVLNIKEWKIQPLQYMKGK